MYRKRTIALTVSIFVLGVIFGILMFDFDTYYFRAFFTVALSISVLFVIIASNSSAKIKSKPFIAVAVLVAAFSFGVLRVSLYNNAVSSYSIYENNNDTARFEVAEVGESWVDLRIVSSEIGVSKGSKVRLYINYEHDFIAGDEFKANVKYSEIDGTSYYKNGINLIASGEIIEKYEVNGLFYRIRKSVIENSKILFDGFSDAEAISKALIVGDRTGLSSYVFSLYKNVGISHVLAISGLHISIIAMGIQSFFALFSVHKYISCGISSVFVVVYAMLVGFSAGAARSAIMLFILLVSKIFKRRTDSITNLFIALSVLLLLNPYSILSKGLELSFLCSLGIILSEPFMYKIREWKFVMIRKTKGIKKLLVWFVYIVGPSVVVSFSAIVFSFPILCFGYDTISYLSPVINLLTVYVYSIAIKFTFASFLVAPISTKIATFLAYPAGKIIDFVTKIARYFYDVDIGTTSVYQPFVLIPFVISIFMIITFVFFGRNKIKVFALSSVFLCASIFGCVIYNNNFASKKMIAEYSSSSSEYIYVQHKGENVYYDIGGYTSNSKTVFENGKTSLDKYVILDYNSYTYSRLKRTGDNLKIYEIHLPKPRDTYQFSILSQIRELANERNYDIILFENEYTHVFSDESVTEVFYPNENDRLSNFFVYDNGETKIRLVNGNNGYLIDCDVAVLMKNFHGSYDYIISDKIAATEDYIKDNDEISDKLIGFYPKIRIEYSEEESGILIYEP